LQKSVASGVNKLSEITMGMSKEQFSKLMGFPNEWLQWDMYPDELFIAQAALYKPSDEQASEHDRNGAFHWWLKREPSKDVLRKLVLLSYLDPDSEMGSDVRQYIAKARHCDNEIRDSMKTAK
jgi:hypothetical protein